MKLYHGTNINTYNNIVVNKTDKVLTSIGGGELGQGFYLGESVSMAKTWATGHFGLDACVLEFEIDNQDFARLNLRPLTQKQIYHWWQHLNRTGQRKTFRYGVDVIIGPFATKELSNQYKFESAEAEKLLNNSVITKLP